MTVKGIKENALLETYHGAYINVNYVVKVTVERGVMKRGLEKVREHESWVSNGLIRRELAK